MREVESGTAEGRAAEFGYTASFHGVGGGPFDERVPYGVWRGPGPQTQAVVFEQTSPPSATAAAPYADAAAAPLHERMVQQNKLLLPAP